MTVPCSPCYQCENRSQRCHSTCPEYALFKSEMEQHNAAVNAAREKARMMREYEIRQHNKRKEQRK